jgi:hypothetical protein
MYLLENREIRVRLPVKAGRYFILSAILALGIIP